MLSVVVLTAVCAALTAAAPVNKPQSPAAAYFNRLLTPFERAMCQPYYDLIDRHAGQPKVSKQNTLCGSTYNQYQLITDLVPQIDSEAACASQNLVWAGIDTVNDTVNIAALLDTCGGNLANIAYYQGVYPAGQPNVCAYVSNDELVDFMGAPDICNTAPAMVLCSAIATSITSTDTTLFTTPTSTSIDSTDTTLFTTTTSFTVTTTSFGVTTNSVRTLTSTTWSPVVVTVVTTSVTTSTSVSGTVTFTITESEVFTTSTTVSAVQVITITQTVLPTCSGERLDTCPCRPGKGGFVLVENPLPYYQARCACESLGLDFAAVNEANIDNARHVIDECLDCKRSAWIASWEDVNNDECLALYADGNIAIPENCNHKRPVLCKVNSHLWTSSSCTSSSSSSESCGCNRRRRQHKAAAIPADDGKCGGCPPTCESSSSTTYSCPCPPTCESSSSSSSSSCGCPCPPTCESSSSSSSSGCPCPPTCESSSSSSSSCVCPCPPTCESSSSSSSSSCGCPCPPTCESSSSSSSSSSCGCPCPPTCESSSSSSSSTWCGCPLPPPPPSCPCSCERWTSESCSSTSEWESCDQCQVCCCDQVHYNKNPFAYGQSPAAAANNKPNPNQLKSRTPTPIEKMQHIVATQCAQTDLPDYIVIISLDTEGNQEVVCQGSGASLADLDDLDGSDLNTLFGLCNLSNGAYFNSWNQLEANPCGFVYAIPNVFGYTRFLTNATNCEIPRAAICKVATTSTVSFGSLLPQTTTTTDISTSTSEVTTTIFTTETSTLTSIISEQTTFVVPIISTSITSTSTSVLTRTSPSVTTLRLTTTSETVVAVDTTVTDPSVSTVFTATTTSTSTDFTGTVSTTVTVTLIGKKH